MSTSHTFSFDASSFSGRARLFPLPNLVLFPHVLQPLHIFEPRYKAMFEEAIADDRLIAMSLLAPGWESDYEGRPPLEPIACLGRVATWHAVEDNRYNLLLLGLRRVRLLRELPADKLFREAEVEILEDIYPSAGAAARPALQRQLIDTFQKMLPQTAESREQLEQLASSHLPLGMLTDIMSFTMALPLETKYFLLTERNVDRRAEQLAEHFARDAEKPTTADGQEFPPKFSAN